MCLCDDVEAAESGLAGFLREGRERAEAETERKKRSQIAKTRRSSVCLTSLVCNNLLFLASDTLGFSA